MWNWFAAAWFGLMCLFIFTGQDNNTVTIAANAVFMFLTRTKVDEMEEELRKKK